MERLTKQELRGCNNMDLHSKQMDWQSIYNRLADFEDFMDNHNFENLEDVESILIGLDLSFRTNCRLVGLNTKLKERWQKLKEFVYEYTSLAKECQSDSQASRMAQANKIYAKMEQMEEEE